MNGTLLFSYTASGGAGQLWSADAAGARQIPGVQTVYDIERLGNAAILSASDPQYRYGLYRSDGTAGGTSEFYDGSGITYPMLQMRAAGGRVWGLAGSGSAGTEPWVTDGTTAGTHLVADVNPGTASSFVSGYPNPYHDPFFIEGPGGFVYFQATNNVNGTELFRTDGTATNTRLVCDFVPGVADSLPGPFLRCGSDLFVAADDLQFGREWHKVRADIDPPAVMGGQVALPGATPQIALSFNEPVGSLDASDLSIAPQGGGGAAFSPDHVTFNSGTKTATFTFDSPVADGIYHASIAPGTVTDDAGNVLESGFAFDFVLVNAGVHWSLPSASGSASKVNQIAIGNGGQLDVGTSSLVIDYSAGGSSPLASITSLIASGRNGGGWNGSGIVTSMASGSFTTLSVAEASAALGISGAQTKVFNGQIVDATSVLVKYTYGGDANLDGKINVDDYGRIDFNAPLGTSGWFNGDFNYDGKLNVDDYGMIDFNVGIQGAPLAATAAAPIACAAPAASAASDVPQTAAASITMMSGTLLDDFGKDEKDWFDQVSAPAALLA